MRKDCFSIAHSTTGITIRLRDLGGGILESVIVRLLLASRRQDESAALSE